MKLTIAALYIAAVIWLLTAGCDESKPRLNPANTASGCQTEYLGKTYSKAYYLLHCKDTVYMITIPPTPEEGSSVNVTPH